MPATDVLYEPGMSGLDGELVTFGALALGLVAIGLALRLWLAARAACASAVRAEAAGTVLGPRPGLTTLVGTVESDEAAPVAVLRITETGTEWQGESGWNHSWTEAERSLEARPFVLRPATGERVRVEPGRDVSLVDDLSHVERLGPRRRAREARIERGDTVRACGALRGAPRAGREAGGPYRGDEEAWTLGAPPGGALLLSTKPLLELHRGAERRARGLLGILVVGLALQQAAAGHEYYPLLLRGRARVGEVRGLEPITVTTTDEDGHRTRHHRVEVELDVDGLLLRRVLHSRTGRVALGQRVPVVALPDGSIVHVGTGPHASGAGLLVLVLEVGLVGAWLVYSRLRRHWWERRRLSTSGPGGLVARGEGAAPD